MPRIGYSLIGIALLLLASSAHISRDVQAQKDAPQTKQPAPDPAPPAPTDAYLKLPKEKTAKPNRYFCIKPDTNCKTIRWIVPAGLDKLDPEIPVRDSNALVAIGDAGTYVVQAYGALGDQATDLASCTVTIGTPPPPPPPPPPPGPADPLTAALQAAYNQDADKDKAQSLAFLESAYAGMAGQAGNWSDVKTNGDALTKIKSVIGAPGVGLNATQVTNLRKAIAAEFANAFGTTATTAINLTVLVSELNKIATALKAVK